MNEQIKELAIRAVKNSILEPMHPAITVGEGANKMEIPLIFAEKFAELIVKECVSVGSQAFLKDNSTIPVFPAKQITEHFGVE